MCVKVFIILKGAIKLNTLILKKNAKRKTAIRNGELFTRDGMVYILARAGGDKYALVNLSNGLRRCEDRSLPCIATYIHENGLQRIENSTITIEEGEANKCTRSL
jgi:hypothetical protein